MINSKIILSTTFIFVSLCIYGQEVTSAAGNHFLGGNIQMSWTIGEPVIETCTGNNLCLTQGMHQSHLWITALDELSGLNMRILAYPNPASDYVQLKVESSKQEELTYQLYGMDGKLVSSGNLVKNEATIPMQSYAHSTYLLKVLSNSYVFKTFKVVKTK